MAALMLPLKQHQNKYVRLRQDNHVGMVNKLWVGGQGVPGEHAIFSSLQHPD
jgi:hypothetical protein